jgi:S-adenosylmethionine synthetase
LPDGKIQITFNQNQIETLAISVQHSESANLDLLESLIVNNVLKKNEISIEELQLYFNNKSKFINGGFINDTGLTERKIMCDTYCGLIPHGGGAFSGKDPSKVDRSGAYMSRYVAKNLVANGYCKECLVSVAYVFGEKNPVMLEIFTDNPDNDKNIRSKVVEIFDFSPKAIIDRLSLNKFKYKPTATYGHFTNAMYPWEKVETI